MRIVSLVPHATELCFALGLGEELVAVTHECDYPPAALRLAKVTRNALPPGLDAAAIDTAVRERVAAGDSIYELDRELLSSLRPDLIVTQALCPVCAVSYEEVSEIAKELPSRPAVISLDSAADSASARHQRSLRPGGARAKPFSGPSRSIASHAKPALIGLQIVGRKRENHPRSRMTLGNAYR